MDENASQSLTNFQNPGPPRALGAQKPSCVLSLPTVVIFGTAAQDASHCCLSPWPPIAKRNHTIAYRQANIATKERPRGEEQFCVATNKHCEHTTSGISHSKHYACQRIICCYRYSVVCFHNMHATAVRSMARGKGKTIAIKLNSTAGTGFFYTTRKNVTRTPDKINLIKFDPIMRRRVMFKEGKIK